MTTLAIDKNLINEALKLGHFKNQKEVINTALREFINKRKQTEEFLENSQKDFDREMALLRLLKTMDEVAITAGNAGLTPEILNELLADE